jgi:hypothetical protein
MAGPQGLAVFSIVGYIMGVGEIMGTQNGSLLFFTNEQ